MHSKGICQYQQFFTINKKTVFSQRRQLVHKFLDKRKIPAVLSLLGTNGGAGGGSTQKISCCMAHSAIGSVNNRGVCLMLHSM